MTATIKSAFYCLINQFVNVPLRSLREKRRKKGGILKKYIKLLNSNDRIVRYTMITSHHINGSVPMKKGIYQLLCDLWFSTASSCWDESISHCLMIIAQFVEAKREEWGGKKTNIHMKNSKEFKEVFFVLYMCMSTILWMRLCVHLAK